MEKDASSTRYEYNVSASYEPSQYDKNAYSVSKIDYDVNKIPPSHIIIWFITYTSLHCKNTGAQIEVPKAVQGSWGLLDFEGRKALHKMWLSLSISSNY